MKTSEIKIGMRVEAGEGDDHDTGTVDRVDGDTATVRWDSLVVTAAPIADLTSASPRGDAQKERR